MAFFAALYDSFFFIARDYSIIDSTLNIKNMKGNNTLVSILDKISRFIGPIIGSAIIFFGNQNTTILYTTIFILILSLIPLLKYKKSEHIKDQKLSFKNDILKDKERKLDYLTIFLYRFSETAESVI
jgi:hypothetical protein